MAKKLVCGCFGTIYDAVLSNKPGVMTGNLTDRTDECVNAVAQHMKCNADANKETPGFYKYIFPGAGTLTWEAEKKMEDKQC